jgi:hypothetical protein
VKIVAKQNTQIISYTLYKVNLAILWLQSNRYGYLPFSTRYFLHYYFLFAAKMFGRSFFTVFAVVMLASTHTIQPATASTHTIQPVAAPRTAYPGGIDLDAPGLKVGGEPIIGLPRGPPYPSNRKR